VCVEAPPEASLNDDITRVRSLSREVHLIEGTREGRERPPPPPREQPVPEGGIHVCLVTDASVRDLIVQPSDSLIATVRASQGLPPGEKAEPVLSITTPRGRRLEGGGSFAELGVGEGHRLSVKVDSMLASIIYDIA